MCIFIYAPKPNRLHHEQRNDINKIMKKKRANFVLNAQHNQSQNIAAAAQFEL